MGSRLPATLFLKANLCLPKLHIGFLNLEFDSRRFHVFDGNDYVSCLSFEGGKGVFQVQIGSIGLIHVIKPFSYFFVFLVIFDGL